MVVHAGCGRLPTWPQHFPVLLNKRRGLLPHPLNLGWPYDFLGPAEYGRSDSMQIPN